MTDEGEKRLLADVDTIKRAVLGDEILEQRGLMHRVGKLERWRDSVTVRLAAFSGGVTVLVLIVRYLVLGR